MAASASVAAVVAGPPRPVEVATVTPHAVYLATGDPDFPALCLATPEAVRVPCALVVDRLPTGIGGGTVGEGTVSLAGFEGRVTRWWRPPRPRVAVPVSAGQPTGPVRALIEAVAGNRPLAPPVSRLIGRGPGLTPYYDDVLAGLLVTLAALRSPTFQPLGEAVRALAPTRTTFVSAALLHHATRGECIPQLAAALNGDGIDALRDVGHTSGAGLIEGMHAATAVPA
jgi:hypothetical protein